MRFRKRTAREPANDDASVRWVPASELLFSLPTICDELPVATGPSMSATTFVMDQDDWRQIELVSRSQRDAVHRNFAAIRAVKQEAVGLGYPRIHVREQPRAPLHGVLIDRPTVEAAFAVTGSPLTTVGFYGTDGTLADTFAYVGQTTTVYAVERADQIVVLGISLTGDEVDPVRRAAFRLVADLHVWLVNWFLPRADPSLDDSAP